MEQDETIDFFLTQTHIHTQGHIHTYTRYFPNSFPILLLLIICLRGCHLYAHDSSIIVF